MPPVAAPPTPAAPTPAPAPTPSPAPAAPTPASQKSSTEAFDDHFADLDAPPPAPAPKPAPAPAAKVDPAKPAPKAPAAAPKPEPKKDDAAPALDPELDTGEDFEPPQVGKPGDIRGWALRMGKKAKAATAEAEQLRQRVKQLESSPQNGADHHALAEQLAAANKRIEAYESDMRLTRYERSGEYKEKWEAPFKKAVERAYRDVGELLVTVREANPEDPEHPIERERQATKGDFDRVFQQPLGQATKLAKELFGDSYALVLQHRERIRELQEGMYAAVEEYRTKGAEQEKQTEARSKQEQAFIESAWQKANDSMRAKGAEYFDERPDDQEGNELLQKGMAHADLAFDPEALARYPLPQQIGIHARIKNWAGAFLRNRRDIMSLKAQLEEANATIEELRGSGPGKPAPASEAPAGAPKGLMEEFDERVK